MIKVIGLALGSAVVVFTLLAVYSCLRVSSECSRQEEREQMESNNE